MPEARNTPRLEYLCNELHFEELEAKSRRQEENLSCEISRGLAAMERGSYVTMSILITEYSLRQPVAADVLADVHVIGLTNAGALLQRHVLLHHLGLSYGYGC